MKVKDMVTGNILENTNEFVVGMWAENPERYQAVTQPVAKANKFATEEPTAAPVDGRRRTTAKKETQENE